MRPFVSVIVPNYNHAPFLEDRLNSIFNQTYQNLEIILLDDCSTDGSVEILNRYRENEKVTCFKINEINSGNTFRQWVKGMEKAKGEWIWIAESDDIADPDLLSKLIDQIEDDTVLCWCRSVIIDDEGESSTYLGQREWPNKDHWKDFIPGTQTMKGEEFILNYLYSVNQVVNASSVIFKAAHFPIELKETLFNFTLCGDWYVWIQIIAKGNVSFIEQPLNKFRVHNSTVRHRSDEKMFVFFESLVIIKSIRSLFTISSERREFYTQYLVYIYTNRYSRKEQMAPVNLFRFIQFLSSFNLRGLPLLMKHLIQS